MKFYYLLSALLICLSATTLVFAGDEDETTVRPITDYFSELAEDGSRLEKINAIKDKNERIKARDEYGADGLGWPDKWYAVGTLAASGGLAALLGEEFMRNPNLWTAALALPTAYAALVAADLGNSEFHFGMDNTWYNKKRGSFMGQLSSDGRRHHEDPQHILVGDYLGRVAEMKYFPALAVGGAAALFKSGLAGKAADLILSPFGVPEGTVGPVVDNLTATFIGSMAFFAAHGTYTHMMSHDPNPGKFWRLLQKLRIAIPQAMHMNHHTPPFDAIYSTQSGIVDSEWWRNREYWQKRLRRYYEKTGMMPGTWIQDPRAIPDDIKKQIQAEYKEKAHLIPPELWAYAPHAYPKRVPEELKEPLDFVQQKWRQDFIQRRVIDFHDLAEVNPEEAKRAWEAEQRAYPWIFGPEPQPLVIPEKTEKDPVIQEDTPKQSGGVMACLKSFGKAAARTLRLTRASSQ